MGKILLFIICFASWASSVFAQKNFLDSLSNEKFNNRKYRREMGIDMKGLFGGFPGGTFIFKQRTGDKKLIAVSYSDYLRFSVSFSGNTTLSSLDTAAIYKVTDDIGLVIKPTESASHYLSLSAGKERIYYYGRFNLYYGADFFLNTGYSHQKQFISGTFTNNNAYVYLEIPVRTFSAGAEIVPFFGMKYRISERFSVSIESGFYLGYTFRRLKWGDKESNLAEDQNPIVYFTHQINHSMVPLRLLTFNYHFKQYN